MLLFLFILQCLWLKKHFLYGLAHHRNDYKSLLAYITTGIHVCFFSDCLLRVFLRKMLGTRCEPVGTRFLLL